MALRTLSRQDDLRKVRLDYFFSQPSVQIGALMALRTLLRQDELRKVGVND